LLKVVEFMSVYAWIVASSSVLAVAPAPSLAEGGCSALVQPEGGAVTIVNDEALRVLEQTRGNAAFVYERKNTGAIRCLRSDIVPAVTDYKVLAAGFPFYIVHSTSAATRVGVLERSSGQFRFRMAQGELTADERERLLARLNEIQVASRKAD
jgi:hypothetical protein